MQSRWQNLRSLSLLAAASVLVAWTIGAPASARAQEGNTVLLPIVVQGSASGGGGGGGGSASTGQVAAGGGSHSLAVLADGTVRAAGYNPSGELGNGATDRQRSGAWVATSGLMDAVAVGTGESHSHAIKSDGTLWGWGRNNQGQLGDGSDGQDNRSLSPVQAQGLDNAVAVEAGLQYSLVLKSDGTVWGMGEGNMTGTGTDNQTIAVQVPNLENVSAIAGGQSHALALLSDGTVMSWGNGQFGRLGDGTEEDRDAPALIPNFGGVVAVAAGDDHSLAVKERRHGLGLGQQPRRGPGRRHGDGPSLAGEGQRHRQRRSRLRRAGFFAGAAERRHCVGVGAESIRSAWRFERR